MNDTNGDKGRGFIERLLSNPAALTTLLIAVVGQALFSIIFQVINNEQQEARISSNAQALVDFKVQVNSMQTPLSQHVFKLEDAVIDAKKASDDLGKRVDTIDTAGTRALSLISANQQRVMSQVDRLSDRIIMTDRKIVEVEGKSAAPVIQARLDEFARNLIRVEEQQKRIIEALDNLYSQVSKVPPILRNKKE